MMSACEADMARGALVTENWHPVAPVRDVHVVQFPYETVTDNVTFHIEGK